MRKGAAERDGGREWGIESNEGEKKMISQSIVRSWEDRSGVGVRLSSFLLFSFSSFASPTFYARRDNTLIRVLLTRRRARRHHHCVLHRRLFNTERTDAASRRWPYATGKPILKISVEFRVCALSAMWTQQRWEKERERRKGRRGKNNILQPRWSHVCIDHWPLKKSSRSKRGSHVGRSLHSVGDKKRTHIRYRLCLWSISIIYMMWDLNNVKIINR